MSGLVGNTEDRFSHNKAQMTDRKESITVIRQEIGEIIGNLIVDLLSVPQGVLSLFTHWSNGQQSQTQVKWQT